jgi:putative Mn2+ efflux pump MntP
MKKAVLWIGVVALVLLGLVMIISTVTMDRHYPVTDEQIVQEHEPKLRRMFEEEKRRRELEEYKIEFQYVTVAVLGFTLAAFLAGRARRIGG